MENIILKIMEILKLQSDKNEDKHIHVIVIGLISAIILSIFLIGSDNLKDFFGQFSTNISSSNILGVALFLTNSILVVLFIISGLLELNEAKEKFEAYIPQPPNGAWLLNILISILLTLQLYTSITNILQYCIVYVIFIFVDVYFRFALSNNANNSIESALRDIAFKKTISDSADVELDKKYNMLIEMFVYYKRYPVFLVATIRILLSTLSLTLVVFGKYTGRAYLSDYAYVNMIYCIIINEILSFGYRITMVVKLKMNS